MVYLLGPVNQPAGNESMDQFFLDYSGHDQFNLEWFVSC